MNRFFLIAWLYLSLLTANAQSDWNFNLYGVGQNTMLLNKADSDSNSVRYQASFGGAIGAGVTYHWTELWGIGLDVVYSFQGQRKEYGLNDTLFPGIYEDVKLQYVKIPVTARYRSDSDTRFQYRAAFGPTFMVLVNATKKQIVPAKEAEGDATDEYNLLNWGLYMSHGLQYKLGKRIWLTFDLTADWALSDAEDKDAVVTDLLFETTSLYPTDRPKTHNVTLGAAFGVELPLGSSKGVVRNR
jgi:hypothetical protein